MKKLRIDIQMLLHNGVNLTAIQNFLSIVNFSDILNHSTDLFPNGKGYASYSIMNKKETQSFQLPK
jgi:hypothetical protein